MIQRIYKVIAVIFLVLTSNYVRMRLDIDPTLPVLGHSSLLNLLNSLLFSLGLCSLYCLFFGLGRIAVCVLGGCAIVYGYYPAYLLVLAIFSGEIASVHPVIFLFTGLAISTLCLSVIKLTKTETIFDLTNFDQPQVLTLLYFFVALPSILVSGMFGDYTSVFLHNYAAFLYVVFLVFLLSIWLPKTLDILPFIVFIWSLAYLFFVASLGFFKTGYFISLTVHVIWASLYLHMLWKRRASSSHP